MATLSAVQPGSYKGTLPDDIYYGRCQLNVIYATFDTTDDPDSFPEARIPTSASLVVAPNFKGMAKATDGTLISVASQTFTSDDGTFDFYCIDGTSPGLNPTDWNWTATLNTEMGSTSIVFQPDRDNTINLGSLLPLTTANGVPVIQGEQGPAGPAGEDGPAGPANTLTVGTVTQGAVGDPASAIITGDAPDQTLSLQFPGPSNTTPAPPTQLGNPGSGTEYAAANHQHPIGYLGRSMIFGGQPNNLTTNDFIFDGTTTVKPGGQNTPPASGVYTLDQSSVNGGGVFTGVSGRNITVNAGVTVTSVTGHGMILMASDAITINGTLAVNGHSGSGATGGEGATTWAGFMGGGSGADGSTGAGTKGGYPMAISGLTAGGPSGAGGASGSTTGGAAAAGGTFVAELGMLGVVLLKPVGANVNNPYAGGGAGGSSGAGDGTNSGGGGGAGGGLLMLIAPRIVIGSTAVITADGGDGAAGTGGNAGGGGGGGGGLVNIQCLELDLAPGATIHANGGSGGAGSGTGAPGLPGGKSWFTDPGTLSGGFGFGDGVRIGVWQ